MTKNRLEIGKVSYPTFGRKTGSVGKRDFPSLREKSAGFGRTVIHGHRDTIPSLIGKGHKTGQISGKLPRLIQKGERGGHVTTHNGSRKSKRNVHFPRLLAK